jgi:hypothetical protein
MEKRVHLRVHPLFLFEPTSKTNVLQVTKTAALRYSLPNSATEGTVA